MITYQPLNNLIDIHTIIPDSSSVAQLFLASGDIYFIQVAASLIGSEYGPSAVTTYAKGISSYSNVNFRNCIPQKILCLIISSNTSRGTGRSSISIHP